MEMARQCTSGKLPVRGMEIVFLLVEVEVARVFFFFRWEEELDEDAADGVVES
jgi:hypothetical protein